MSTNLVLTRLANRNLDRLLWRRGRDHATALAGVHELARKIFIDSQGGIAVDCPVLQETTETECADGRFIHGGFDSNWCPMPKLCVPDAGGCSCFSSCRRRRRGTSLGCALALCNFF